VDVQHAELHTVGPHEVVVTFTTSDDAVRRTRVGDAEVTTTGPVHVVTVTGLEPDTDYPVEVEGAEPGAYLPELVRTLVQPRGRLLATVATANDVHFGEVETGHLGPPHEDIGPILRADPGAEPYPVLMNRAVIAEMRGLDPDAVVVKGDLTAVGAPEEYGAFLAAYGVFGDRLAHVRGNHDAMQDPTLALEGAPYAVSVGSVTLAVLDTVLAGRDTGQLTRDQVQWLDDLAAETAGPVLVFGHHQAWNLDSHDREADYFGINPDDTEALGAVVARRENIVGYFAGHTHRNRIRRSVRARDVPFVEIGCTKDYPGAWAEYRIYEGGYTQLYRRVTTDPVALAWAELTRAMFLGLYRDYALGPLEWRCFTQVY
jgi:predicted phosphodiesterase